MLAQYVYSAKIGMFRIVRHGRRWRSMLDMQEVDRHDSAESALEALRLNWPHARLPARIADWRYVPELALAHSRVSGEPATRWRLAG
ncbi:hypothetical protein [Dyella subtropica]|uniref:hypothetical protein n=1 Tax=Dyella subtropica TaxID=2992127 RepID=UPI00224FD829|nr:hypothetical protein [Dyella subtropica]